MAHAKLREIAQAAQNDPYAALMDALPKAAFEYEVFHSKVLVATYIPPERTKGGIIKPDRSLQEDRFQGKVGLVIKCGPLAFEDDRVNHFGGVKIKPGDWVTYRPSDGIEIFFVDDNGRDAVPCRLIEDSNVLGRTPDPALIY
jgi:co-chaperonin GroES (HSP10)